MSTHKFGVKLFFKNSTKPLKEFIPVFHGWIQRQALSGHMLLDVHDYSHVHHGPGILLVSHEANISIDEAEGRRGLAYVCKQPATLKEIIAAANEAAKLLGESIEAGKFEVFVNDRLASVTAADVTAATGGKATQKVVDPRGRVTFAVQL